MPVPTNAEIRIALLQHVDDEREYHRKDIEDALSNEFSLTDEDRKEATKGGRARFPLRCSWAFVDLKREGLLESTKRGHYRITSLGVEAVRQDPESINRAFMKQLRESVESSDNHLTPKNTAVPLSDPHENVQRNLTEDEKAVFNAIETPSSHIDAIVRMTGFPTAKVSSLLSMMELKGIIEQMAGKQFSKPNRDTSPAGNALQPNTKSVTETAIPSGTDEINHDFVIKAEQPSERRKSEFIDNHSSHSAHESTEPQQVPTPPDQIENDRTPLEAIETTRSKSGTSGHAEQQPQETATDIRTAWDPVTGKEYAIVMPAREEIRQTLLDMEFPPEGIRIKDAMKMLAAQFSLSDEQKNAKNKHKQRVFYELVYGQMASLTRLSQLTKLPSGLFVHRGRRHKREVESNVDPNFSRATQPFQRDLDYNISGQRVYRFPEKVLETNYQGYRKQLSTILQNKITSNSPSFFGILVLNLLTQMGYAKSLRDVESIERSVDGGIAGLFDQDKFGLDSVYIQAKWREETIDQSEVQKFALELREHRTRKGVFITSSKFSEDAEEYVNAIDSKIVLIDGYQLAEFMIDYNVGVTTVKSYEIKRVDSDYFIETDDSRTQG